MTDEHQPADRHEDTAEDRIASARAAITHAAKQQAESEAAQTALTKFTPEELEAARAQQHADELAEKLPDTTE